MENIITVGDIINDLKGEKRYRVVSISQHYAVLCQMDIPNLNLIEYDISTLLELKLGHEITIDHEEANWCYFCELDFMLCLRHGKQPFLPLVICLATDTMLFAPCQYALPTVSAFCDSFSPYRQFVLLI